MIMFIAPKKGKSTQSQPKAKGKSTKPVVKKIGAQPVSDDKETV
jgi:gas vesicle protein